MKIPILRIPYTDESVREVQSGIAAVLRSGQLAAGKYVAEFEERFAEFCGARYAIATHSGTSALEIILRAIGVQDASVIVPTNTFIATAFAAISAGARVIFADCDPEDLSLDPDDLERKLEPDTRVVMLVHIGGIISGKLEMIRQICARRGIHLVEDCAHAHGSRWNGASAGTLGAAGAFSFFPTKVITCGEGGMITTADEGLYREALILRNHGKNPQRASAITGFGYNWRMSEFNAVVGVEQMKRVQEIVRERQQAARFYDQHLEGIAGLRAVPLPAGVESTYYKYVAYLDGSIDRNAFKKTLRDEFEVQLTGEVYATLCHQEPVWERTCYCGRQRSSRAASACCRTPFRRASFPGAEQIAAHHICLPLYPGLSRSELEYVVASLERALAHTAGLGKEHAAVSGS
jgi:dTDP-4-amino-4,6-dideoxygalactose transaminase